MFKIFHTYNKIKKTLLKNAHDEWENYLIKLGGLNSVLENAFFTIDRYNIQNTFNMIKKYRCKNKKLPFQGKIQKQTTTFKSTIMENNKLKNQITREIKYISINQSRLAYKMFYYINRNEKSILKKRFNQLAFLSKTKNIYNHIVIMNSINSNNQLDNW